eukprot:PITA_27712
MESSCSSMNSNRHSTEKRCLRPLQKQGASMNKHSSDRFIPARGSIDLDVARFMVTQKQKDNNDIHALSPSPSPSKKAYQKEMAATLLKNAGAADNNCRILSFNGKSSTVSQASQENVLANLPISRRARRYIPQSADRTLDAPDLLDDYYLNLLDWSSTNVLSIALDNTVYLWDASNSSISELLIADEEEGPVTGVSWAPDGSQIAVGLNNSVVQLWDSQSNKKLRALKGHHDRVGALSWNGPILTTGGRDGIIINHDVRTRDHIVQTYKGHTQEVCGLKWSPSGQQLASGGNDNLLYIWDKSMASHNPSSQYFHQLDEHCAAVKALAWCPFQTNLLASGGGTSDGSIKFWNTQTGACLNTVDTHSQVCSLLWNRHERELLSSHGLNQNQLTLWKYPSMVKITELTGHTARVLHMAQSPDGYTVASAAADETLKFWQVFGAPDASKKTKTKDAKGAFNMLHMHIR